MNLKRTILTFAFVGLAMMLAADSTLVSSQVNAVVRVYPSEDIETLFTDLGLEEDYIEYLSWNGSQIPWDVKADIDTLVAENRSDFESLVQEAIEDLLVLGDSRTAFMEIGSNRWFIYPSNEA